MILKLSSDLFHTFTIKIKRKEARGIYRGDATIQLNGTNNPLFLINRNDITRNHLSRRGGKNIGRIIVDHIRKKNSDDVSNFLKNESDKIPDFEFSKEELDDFFKKIDPDDPDAVYDLGSVRFNEGHLKEKNPPQQIRLLEFFGGNRQQSIFDLLSRIFNSSIVRTSNLRSTPNSFLTLENSFQSRNVDMKSLSGETLPEILFQLRNSTRPHIRKRYTDIQTEFKKICDGLEFDIGIRPKEIITRNETESFSTTRFPQRHGFKTTLKEDDNKKTTYENELLLQFVRGNITIPIEHAAAGLFEILLLITALIGQKGKIILLDEPAVNLHPSLQRQILEKIEKEVVCESKNQVIMITHSPYLINPLNMNGIWRVYSSKFGSGVVNVGETLQGLDKKIRDRITTSLQYSDIRSVFFSRGIVLVEGLSDKLVVEQIDRYLVTKKKGMRLDENDWYVIEMVGGKHSLWTYIKMADELHIPYLSVMDYDALMRCDKNVKINNTTIRISSILRSLFLMEKLSKDDQNTVTEISQKLEDGWYQQDQFDTLNSISQRNHCFVFRKDLEGVLRTPLKKKQSKPLKNLDTVLEKIELGDIPQEFFSMAGFINTIINNQNLDSLRK